MHPFLPHRFKFVSPLPPSECASRVDDWIEGNTIPGTRWSPWDELVTPQLSFNPGNRPLKGKANSAGFIVAKRLRYQNFAQTWASGTFTPAQGGTLVDVTLWIDPIIYLAFFAFPVGLLGIDILGWILGRGLVIDYPPAFLMFPVLVGSMTLLGRLLAWDDGPWLLQHLMQIFKADESAAAF